jgi:hypothetical protein
MDLLAAQRRHGKQWNAARIGALLCFIVAGGILMASLVFPNAHLGGGENGLAASITGQPTSLIAIGSSRNQAAPFFSRQHFLSSPGRFSALHNPPRFSILQMRTVCVRRADSSNTNPCASS